MKIEKYKKVGIFFYFISLIIIALGISMLKINRDLSFFFIGLGMAIYFIHLALKYIYLANL